MKKKKKEKKEEAIFKSVSCKRKAFNLTHLTNGAGVVVILVILMVVLWPQQKANYSVWASVDVLSVYAVLYFVTPTQSKLSCGTMLFVQSVISAN